jgi:hypothetical protein
MLYELVLFIQNHVANVMIEFTVLAGVASLATLVAGQCGQVLCLGAINIPGGRAGVYGFVGAFVDAGDEVDEVAGQENENGVCMGVDWVYWGVIDCAGRRWT